MRVPAYPSLDSCLRNVLLGQATGDAAYTTLGKMGDACVLLKETEANFKESKEHTEYEGYAARLRRELVWQVSYSCQGAAMKGKLCFCCIREGFPSSHLHVSEFGV